MRQVSSKPSASMTRKPAFVIMLVVLAAACVPCGAASFYRLQSVEVLPGKSPAWDYLTYDASRAYLFMGRRHAGVTVYDVKTRKVVATIADSRNANRAILVPEVGRGFTVNEDGSTTEFDLASLRTLRRIHFGDDADSGSYEPVTGQIMFTMGDSRKVAFMDARSGRITARLPMQSNKVEASAPDGQGNIFVAERDRNRVVRINARKHEVTARWPTAPCRQPTGLAYDGKHKRIFVGCRSSSPMLAVLDAKSGNVVATLEIGRGNDGVVYVPSLREIFTSNGIDGNVVVIRQLDADRYRLEQAITTRPMARTMAFDASHDRFFMVTAQGAVDPAKKIDRAVAPFYPNVYFDGTFVVLTYAPETKTKTSIR